MRHKRSLHQAALSSDNLGSANHENAMPEESHGPDLFEIIRTTRSMRRLKPDAVPNELTRKILEAGVCAPSGGNMRSAGVSW